jgi:vacuolar-type H+-ATPase catalytic subunit A/Vma1
LERIANMTRTVYLPRGVDVQALDRKLSWPFQVRECARACA